ncbi:MAG: DUF3467 domain-containing protein [Rikenellaceae bacterium]|nr:DUF3467 domain-containing protein [Rikenellaceae bacterium]
MDKKHEIDIELDEAVAQGNYANLAIISHSASEFVIDFAALMPGVPKAKVKNRIILAPEHAKRLLMSLQDNITRYESNVGRINITNTNKQAESQDEQPGPMTVGFNVGEA